METCPQQPFSGKMRLGWGGKPICGPKFMEFLDSQILSGTYFHHQRLINCKILHLIKILSTELFAMSLHKLKSGNCEKCGFQCLIWGPFCPLIQKIAVIFDFICHSVLSFIDSNEIRPNSYESSKIDLCIWLFTSNSISLRVVVTNSPQLIKVRDLNGCHGNQTKLGMTSYMVATESPTVITFEQHIQHDFVELHFFRARWLWGGDLVCRVVFAEKQIAESLLFWMQITIAKISVDRISTFFHILMPTSCASK